MCNYIYTDIISTPIFLVTENMCVNNWKYRTDSKNSITNRKVLVYLYPQ